MRMDGTGCLYAFHLGRSWLGHYPCCLDEGHEGEHKHLDDTWRKWADRSSWMSPEELEALPEVIEYRAFIEQMREDLRSPIKAVREEAWTRKFTPKNSAQFAEEKVTDMATIGAEQLRNKYKGDSIAIAEAWILGHLDYNEDYFVRECVNVIDVAAARARMELRAAGHAVPPAPVKL